MYEVFECVKCQNVFSMNNDERIAFCKAGGCAITCPKCGCYGIDRITCVDAGRILPLY